MPGSGAHRSFQTWLFLSYISFSFLSFPPLQKIEKEVVKRKERKERKGNGKKKRDKFMYFKNRKISQGNAVIMISSQKMARERMAIFSFAKLIMTAFPSLRCLFPGFIKVFS